MEDRIVFVAAKRTPFGAFGGSFKDLTATDLAVHASKSALESLHGEKTAIDHVIFGNVLATSADAAYLARHVALRSGLDPSVPAVTINRLCGSGFESIVQATHRIRLNESRTCLVGGTENMTQAPYVLRKARFGYRMNHAELEDSLMAGLSDSFTGLSMAVSTENLASQYEITRTQADEFSLRSQTLAAKATKEGIFNEELSPVPIRSKGKETLVTADEHIRFDASIDSLSKLKPIFKSDGIITAGNASGMVDGASAMVVTTESVAKSRGWKVLGYWVDSFVIGCDPSLMGYGPVPACQGLFKKTGLSLDQMNLIEINEAFSAQTLVVAKALKIPLTKLNTHGGAVAIGHPLAASGTRLVTHLLYSLAKTGGGYGLASACIGGGQGLALIVKVGS